MTLAGRRKRAEQLLGAGYKGLGMLVESSGRSFPGLSDAVAGGRKRSLAAGCDKALEYIMEQLGISKD